MRTKALLLSLALTFGLAAAAYAADESGTVLSVNDTQITLRLDDGRQVTYPLASNVTVRAEDGQPLAMADLSQKRVNLDLDDQQRAAEIEVVSDQANAAAAQNDPTAAAPSNPAGDERAQADQPPQGDVAQNQLPATASPVTLTALLGGLSLVAGGVTRALRRR